MKLTVFGKVTGPDDGRTPLKRGEVRELFRRQYGQRIKGERLISYRFIINWPESNELPYTRNLLVYDVEAEFTEYYH